MNPFGPGNDPRDDDADAIAWEMKRRGFCWSDFNGYWINNEGEVVLDAAEYLRGFKEG